MRLRNAKPEEMYSSANDFLKALIECKVVESGNSKFFTKAVELEGHSELQPTFNKQFEMLKQSLSDYNDRGYTMCISVSSEQQRKRLDKIFVESQMEDMAAHVTYLDYSLRKGFIDHDEHLLCYTDHEIFERYHKRGADPERAV